MCDAAAPARSRLRVPFQAQRPAKRTHPPPQLVTLLRERLEQHSAELEALAGAIAALAPPRPPHPRHRGPYYGGPKKLEPGLAKVKISWKRPAAAGAPPPAAGLGSQPAAAAAAPPKLCCELPTPPAGLEPLPKLLPPAEAAPGLAGLPAGLAGLAAAAGLGEGSGVAALQATPAGTWGGAAGGVGTSVVHGEGSGQPLPAAATNG